ncbi:MAG: hypothetical protein WBM50_20195 [Acidimicrobiales bacterium]
MNEASAQNPEQPEQAHPDPHEGRDRSSRRSAVPVAVATVVAVVSVFSTWIKVQALQTDTWVSLADELVQSPEIQEALAVYLVDELYLQLDVSTEIGDRLPEDFEGLAGPISSALRGPATSGAERIIASDRFRTVWLSANRTTHETLVAILRDDTRPGVSTADGTVTLELQELLRQVGAQFGLSTDALDRLPEDAARITIFESDEMRSAQSTVQILDFLSWFLLLVVVGLYGAAVYLAPGRRRLVLRNVGLSLIAAGVVVLLSRILAVKAAVDTIVTDPGSRPVANVAAYVATGVIRQIAWSGIVYGVLIAGFAALLGDHRWARATRRVLAPALNASVGAVTGGTVMLVLLLLLWSPGTAFDRLVSGAIVIALVVAAVVTLRRTTQREFPDVKMGDVVNSIRHGMPTAMARVGSAPEAATMTTELAALRDLHRDGTLADVEYEEAKRRVIAG